MGVYLVHGSQPLQISTLGREVARANFMSETTRDIAHRLQDYLPTLRRRNKVVNYASIT